MIICSEATTQILKYLVHITSSKGMSEPLHEQCIVHFQIYNGFMKILRDHQEVMNSKVYNFKCKIKGNSYHYAGHTKLI